MIQVIQEKKKPSFGEKINMGLESLNNLNNQFLQEKKAAMLKEQENEALKRFGIDASGYSPEMKEKAFQAKLNQNEEERKHNRELVEEADIKAKVKSFADKIEQNNPKSPIHKTIADIYRSDLPFKEQTKLVENLTGVDPFKMQQQIRLKLDSDLKIYNARIKEINEDIKNLRNPNSTDKQEYQRLLEERRILRAERDAALDFRALNHYGEDYDESIGRDDEDKKPMFDPNNKEHIAKAEQLMKEYDNKERVRKELSKEFDGL